jgi:hypothetical protein
METPPFLHARPAGSGTRIATMYRLTPYVLALSAIGLLEIVLSPKGTKILIHVSQDSDKPQKP